MTLTMVPLKYPIKMYSEQVTFQIRLVSLYQHHINLKACKIISELRQDSILLHSSCGYISVTSQNCINYTNIILKTHQVCITRSEQYHEKAYLFARRSLRCHFVCVTEWPAEKCKSACSTSIYSNYNTQCTT